MVHMYIVTNTTIFLVVRLLLLRYNSIFRPSMLAIFRLYMRNLSINYTNICGEFTVCGVGWGGCEISFCLLEKKGYGHLKIILWGLKKTVYSNHTYILEELQVNFIRSVAVMCNETLRKKGKANPLQAWTGSEGSRRFRLPDFNSFGT